MRALFLRRRIKQLYNLARNLGQVDSAERCRSVTRLNLRNSRERVEHSEHAVEVCYNIPDQRLPNHPVEAIVSFLQTSAHAVQRRASVVCDIVTNLLQFAHQYP